MILKGENGIRWNRYDINRTRPRHGYKYTKYNLCSVWWWLCQQATPKQNLKLNSWKSKASWKKALLIKKACKRSHILQRNESFKIISKGFKSKELSYLWVGVKTEAYLEHSGASMMKLFCKSN